MRKNRVRPHFIFRRGFPPQRDNEAGKRADTRTWRDDPGKIKRIRRGDVWRGTQILIAADLAQQLDRLGPCELLADETRHEAAAPDFTLRLHAAEGDQQVAP